MENALTQAGEAAAAEQADEVLEQQAGREETETPAEESEEESKPSKRDRTFTQDDVDRLITKNKARVERRYNKQINELKAEMAKLGEAQAAKKEDSADAEGPKEPKRSDFDTYEDYIEARAEYKAGERIRKEIRALEAAREKETKSSQEEQHQKRLMEMANKRVFDGRKEYPDFDAVIQDAFDDGVIVQDSELYLGIIESEFGHRIAYYLSQNPDEAERINKLSPRGVHRELGKLEDKFSKTPEKRKAETMDPVTGRGRTHKPNDPMREDITMDDFVRLRNEQERKRRGF